jgi:hypothetical protein
MGELLTGGQYWIIDFIDYQVIYSITEVTHTVIKYIAWENNSWWNERYGSRNARHGCSAKRQFYLVLCQYDSQLITEAKAKMLIKLWES